MTPGPRTRSGSRRRETGAVLGVAAAAALLLLVFAPRSAATGVTAVAAAVAAAAAAATRVLYTAVVPRLGRPTTWAATVVAWAAAAAFAGALVSCTSPAGCNGTRTVDWAVGGALAPLLPLLLIVAPSTVIRRLARLARAGLATRKRAKPPVRPVRRAHAERRGR